MKRICILYTNPGSGHKMAAEALNGYLKTCSNVQTFLVNFAQEYNISMFKNSSKSYAFIINNFPWLQKLIVKEADNPSVSAFLNKVYYDFVKKHIKDFVTEFPADVYISTNYFDNQVFKLLPQKALKVMLVVDIVYPLRIWFSRYSDLIIMPTREIYNLSEKYLGQFRKKVLIMGLPINQKFFLPDSIKLETPHKRKILFFGGGEGDTRLLQIVESVDSGNNNIDMLVVCGKNSILKKKFDKKIFKNSCKVFGWVNDFPDLLKRADIIVTKAGPTTIWEALAIGKELILYGKIPGVEDGNIEFAMKYSNAKFEKDPKKIAGLIKTWVPGKLKINKIFKTNWAKKIGDLLLSDNLLTLAINGKKKIL